MHVVVVVIVAVLQLRAEANKLLDVYMCPLYIEQNIIIDQEL